MPRVKRQTANDKAVLKEITKYQAETGLKPSRGVLAARTGLHKGTVTCNLLRLKKFGLVTWEPKKHHSIRLAA